MIAAARGSVKGEESQVVIPRAELEKLEINTSSYLAHDSVYKQAVTAEITFLLPEKSRIVS